MKFQLKIVFLFLSMLFIVPTTMAQDTDKGTSSKKEKKKKKRKYKLPDIDLNHWKVTIPAGDPAEVEPPEILDYATNETLKPYMYNDSTRGALVFYAVPNATTANTKYSRSELREQMEPGNNNVNWTFKQGGKMKGRLVMGDVSKGKDGKYHKVMIMQIHGRLTNEQRDLIGQKDNNAPPILKIYWQNGKIRVKTKQLKDLSMSDTDILRTGSWKDDKGFNFDEKVDFRPFTLEVKVSEGKLVVGLNNSQYKVYDDIHIEKWGIFENYFKAGNYFQTRDEGAHAEVKYFSLEVSH